MEGVFACTKCFRITYDCIAKHMPIITPFMYPKLLYVSRHSQTITALKDYYSTHRLLQYSQTITALTDYYSTRRLLQYSQTITALTDYYSITALTDYYSTHRLLQHHSTHRLLQHSHTPPTHPYFLPAEMNAGRAVQLSQ